MATETVTIPSGSGTSPTISNAKPAKSFSVPAGMTSTALTFTVSTTNAGTFVPLRAADNTPISHVIAATAGAQPVPASLSAFPFFKLVFGSAEGGDRVVTIYR